MVMINLDDNGLCFAKRNYVLRQIMKLCFTTNYECYFEPNEEKQPLERK
jgi:hypothetical protein